MSEGFDRNVVVAIGSRNFFGAERRFFKIASYVSRQNSSKLKLYLVINYSLYLSASQIDWAKDFLKEFDTQGKLIIIPDSLQSIFMSKGLLNIFKLVFSTKFRAILHGRVLAIPRLLLGKDTVFEVTSIDEAKHILRKYPNFLLKRVRCFNCVSKTVANDFGGFIKEAGQESLLKKINNDAFPFFLPKDDQSLTIDKKEKTIVFASRFIDRKNPILFAKACKKILDEFPDWKVYVCGKGPLEEEIKEILKIHISNGLVSVLYSTNIENILKLSSIYVSLIEPDNYPSQSILEAMYYSNALLLSRTGTSCRFMSDGEAKNGLMCELDVNNVYEKLKYLCQNFEETKEMGNTSKQFLEDNFSADSYINNFISVTNGI